MVSELRRLLDDLAGLLSAAGAAKATVGDVSAVAAALDPFGNMRVKDFTDLLGRVDQTGSIVPKPGRGGPARGAAKPDPAAVAAEAARLYGSAADPGVPNEQFEALPDKLAALAGPGLKAVAAAVGLKVPARPKNAELVDAICRRIEERRGKTIRRQLLDRPTG